MGRKVKEAALSGALAPGIPFLAMVSPTSMGGMIPLLFPTLQDPASVLSPSYSGVHLLVTMRISKTSPSILLQVEPL